MWDWTCSAVSMERNSNILRYYHATVIMSATSWGFDLLKMCSYVDNLRKTQCLNLITFKTAGHWHLPWIALIELGCHLKCYWALTNEDVALDMHLPREEWRKVKLCVYTCAHLMHQENDLYLILLENHSTSCNYMSPFWRYHKLLLIKAGILIQLCHLFWK